MKTKPQANINDIITDGKIVGIVIHIGINKNKKVVYLVRRLRKDFKEWVHCEHWNIGEWEAGFKILKKS